MGHAEIPMVKVWVKTRAAATVEGLLLGGGSGGSGGGDGCDKADCEEGRGQAAAETAQQRKSEHTDSGERADEASVATATEQQ
jgi:hypothetical protein